MLDFWSEDYGTLTTNTHILHDNPPQTGAVSVFQMLNDSMLGSGCAILTLLGSCHQNCMTLTSAECTVENS